MKNNLTDEEHLEQLKSKMNALKSVVEEYHTLSSEHSKLYEKIRKKNIANNLNKLTLQTDFVECEYPSMGYAARNGSAEFTSQEQAEALTKALSAQASYYYAYVLEWSGPGKYTVVPDYKYDHDGETIYTANFVKVIE